MSPALACLAVAFIGVDIGYQPAANGGLDLIVQIDPATFQTFQPGDPIRVDVPREAQQVRPSQITVALSESRPPRVLPTTRESQTGGLNSAAPRPDPSSIAPAPAPNVAAVPLLRPQVNRASAEDPAPAVGPALVAPGMADTVRVKPPAGQPAFPATTEPRSQGTSGFQASSIPAATGTTSVARDEPFVPSSKPVAVKFDGWQFVLCMAIIGLAASNGYVGWLFYDARLRYLNLLARTFAAAK